MKGKKLNKEETGCDYWSGDESEKWRSREKCRKKKRRTRVHRLRRICAPEEERPVLASSFRPVIRPWRSYFL